MTRPARLTAAQYDDEGCPECGGEGWIEDDWDPVNDALYDDETGAEVLPLDPCPYCNPDGERIEAEELLDDE